MSKREKIFLFFLLLLLPSQLALHFWPSWSLLNGIRVDYLSPTLYFTDLLIFGLFLFSRLRIRVPLPVIIFIVLNILISYLPLISLYKWFRALEYFWLFKYLTQTKINWKFFSWAVLWTSLLAWTQFFLQHSAGGAWYWMGERPLSATMPAIAKISFFGYQLLRPYATLSHPNALAGFLLVSGLILYSVNRKITPTLVLVFLTIPLTFSRSAIFLEALILFFWLRPTILKVILLPALYFLITNIQGSLESLPDRLILMQKSFFLIFKFPILGVGLGNFLPATGLYQPVHTIYLLLASELGLPAVLFIGYLIIENYLKIGNWKLKIAILVVATTGLVDHYWLTLHQNSLLLVLLLSLLYAKPTHHLLRRGSQR